MRWGAVGVEWRWLGVGCVNCWVNCWVNGRLPAAPEGATRRLRECTAAGRSAAEVGARAKADAPPSRRGLIVELHSDELAECGANYCVRFSDVIVMLEQENTCSIYVDVIFVAGNCMSAIRA